MSGDVGLDAIDTQEGERIIDAAAQRLLSISGAEFESRWEAGAYEGDDRLAVMKVAMLLPLAGR